MRKQLMPAFLLGLFMALAGCIGDGGDDSGSASAGGSGGSGGSGGTGSTAGTGGNGGTGGGSAQKACVDEADGVKKCTLDASAFDKYTYLSLATGDIVALTDEQSKTSSAWDIAFRRFAVKTNGGSSGAGKRGAELVVAQSDFYNQDGTPNQNKFVNATPEAEREHLTGPLTIPASWVADKVTSALAPEPVNDATGCTPVTPPAYRVNYGWYTYSGGCLPSPHSLSANSNTGWLLRSATGDSYSRFRATAVSFSQQNGLSATFEFVVQLANTSSFTESRSWSVANLANGERCYDFDAGAATADCTGTIWDLKLTVAGQDIYLRTNSGPSGGGLAGGLGPQPWTTISGYANGTTAVAGAPYVADSSSSVIDTKSWYAYNVTNGDHRLWPNYRVYMINADTDNASSALYAVQVISYYKDTGASGFPQLRYRVVPRP